MIPGMGSIGAGRVGIGANFAKSRLMLAKRAGYLPENTVVDQSNPSQQWKAMSSNLARDSRAAGFQNPMQFLRQGAQQGPGGPKRTQMRPGALANPAGSLPYANSRIAAQTARQPRRAIGPGQPPGQGFGNQNINPQVLIAIMQALQGMQRQGPNGFQPPPSMLPPSRRRPSNPGLNMPNYEPVAYE